MTNQTDGEILPHGESELMIQKAEDDPPVNVGRVLLRFSTQELKYEPKPGTYRYEQGETIYYEAKNIIVCQNPNKPYDYLAYGEIKKDIWAYLVAPAGIIIEYLMKKLGLER